MPIDQWNPKPVLRKLESEMVRRMSRAVLIVKGETQRKLSTGQPVVRRGANLVGLNPSRPGEPPHVLSSRLKNSITTDVKIKSQDVVGLVGTNVEYARRQELGFVGTDSLGRNVSHAPRPYLRPALKENIRKVLKILGGGSR